MAFVSTFTHATNHATTRTFGARHVLNMIGALKLMNKPCLKRMVFYMAAFTTAFTLAGCSILPGMNASFGKPPIVRESPEEPANIDYTLLMVTP